MSSQVTDKSYLRFESNIVWLRDVNNMPYVREHFHQFCRRRKGKLKHGDHEVVGYAELEKDAPNTGTKGCFARRIFWLKEADRANQPNGIYQTGCPSEAVDPLTIAPKVVGQRTPRACGEALPSKNRPPA